MSQSERRPRRRQCRTETLCVGLAEHAVPELGEIVDAVPPRGLIDVKTRAEWDDYLDWLIKYGERFDILFGTYIREFERRDIPR